MSSTIKFKYTASTGLFILVLWGTTFYLTLPGVLTPEKEYMAVSLISLMLLETIDYLLVPKCLSRRFGHLMVGGAVLWMIYAYLYWINGK